MFRPYVKSVAASQEDLEAQAAEQAEATATAGSSVPTTAPTTPAAGDIYFDKTSNKLKVYNGSAWKEVALS